MSIPQQTFFIGWLLLFGVYGVAAILFAQLDDLAIRSSDISKLRRFLHYAGFIMFSTMFLAGGIWLIRMISVIMLSDE
jgi:hypothetical protein